MFFSIIFSNFVRNRVLYLLTVKRDHMVSVGGQIDRKRQIMIELLFFRQSHDSFGIYSYVLVHRMSVLSIDQKVAEISEKKKSDN